MKNSYDNYSDIKIIITGSSLREVNRGQADLSRRAVTYYLSGWSFREFLELVYHQKLPSIALSDIVQHHHEISADYYDRVDIDKMLKEYLQHGYYPFFKEGISNAYYAVDGIKGGSGKKYRSGLLGFYTDAPGT